MANKLFSYRPALDGIRGYAMFLFLLWHVGALVQLPGTWLYMNVFFVLSAFLITRLLLAERRDRGYINIAAFYRRRARRLLPALLLTLAAVTVDGLFFAPAPEKAFLKGDVFASLFYVMNWRLVARDDQYFEDFTHPSITRHIWSLSVEEQFYLFVPLILIVVIRWTHRRWTRTAPFIIVAAAMALWSTTIDLGSLTGQAHAYYGTDIRLQPLAVGVAAGVWAAHRGSGRALVGGKQRSPVDSGSPALEIAGWLCFVGLALGAYCVEPLSAWMFSRGGMLLFAVLAGIYVVACSSRAGGALARCHAWKPLAYSGRISYGVYLYHWPIFLWLKRYFGAEHIWWLALATLVLTYALAAASYRYIERPFMRYGLDLFRRRFGAIKATAAALTVVTVCAAFGLSGGSFQAQAQRAQDLPDVPQHVAHIPQLVPGQPSYRQPSPPARVALFGDSVAFFLGQRMPQQNFPGLQIVNLATPGCDLLDIPLEWSPSVAQGDDEACRAGKANYAQTLKSSGATTFVIVPSLLLVLHHRVHGRSVWLDDPEYVQQITSKLTQITRRARSAGAKTVEVTTVPCRRLTELNLPPQYRSSYTKDPRLVSEAGNPVRVNTIIKQWAAKDGVPVVDLAGPICGSGYQPKLHGITLFEDGIHFSTKATPMIWGWLAPQVLSKADDR